MPFDEDDIRAAEELNRLWDARNLGERIADETPDLALVDQLFACDDAPLPPKTSMLRCGQPSWRCRNRLPRPRDTRSASLSRWMRRGRSFPVAGSRSRLCSPRA